MRSRFDKALGADAVAEPIDSSHGNKRRSPAILKFFTIEQVADEHEVAPRTVQRWIAEGLLIAHRFGRAVRIAEPDLRAFQARHRDV